MLVVEPLELIIDTALVGQSHVLPVAKAQHAYVPPYPNADLLSLLVGDLRAIRRDGGTLHSITNHGSRSGRNVTLYEVMLTGRRQGRIETPVRQAEM